MGKRANGAGAIESHGMAPENGFGAASGYGSLTAFLGHAQEACYGAKTSRDSSLDLIMRVAYDHQIFDWQEYGGISRYAFEIASHISRMPGCEAAVFAPFYINRYLQRCPPQLQVKGRRIARVPGTGRIIHSINSLIVRPLLVRYRPDIVHETYYSPRGVAPRGAKVVLTVHDMIHELFPSEFSSADHTSEHKRAAVRRADHIICDSNNTRKDLIGLLGIPEEKISVVYLGFSLMPSIGNESTDYSEKKPFLLYVGGRRGYKNFENVLKAIAASPRLSEGFDLVCFGGGPLTQDERALIDQLKLRGVRQVGGDDSILAGLYLGARALVYPSLYEGFGIPPLEAMSYGCPVVCSDVSSIPEVVGDAAETFDPYDVDSMRRAMELIVYDETMRQTLIERGRSQYKKFSWERCAQETLAVYGSVLSQK